MEHAGAQMKRQREQHAQQRVNPGDVITTDTDVLRGHGTYVDEGTLVASLSGTVEKINKLVSVRPGRARYSGEVGDVVVGRVTEVAPKRWKLDINARQEGTLLLSAINLPGGVQRRRTHEDELQMRSFFTEGDLVSAEIREFYADGSIMLHTRSLKYGKLGQGQFVAVPSGLVKRLKQHFHNLECGVAVILGNNGYIWVYPAVADELEATGMKGFSEADAEATAKAAEADVPLSTRENICRVRNAILALAAVFAQIHPQTIADVMQASADIAPSEMLEPETIERVTASARAE